MGGGREVWRRRKVLGEMREERWVRLGEVACASVCVQVLEEIECL